MKYVRLIDWSAAGDSIRLEMLAEDQTTHAFEVSAECAGALVAALAAETEKLQDKAQQFIRPTAIQAARTEHGEAIVLMTLQSGAELPLVFQAQGLTLLIAELEGLLRVVEPGSEIRWN